MQSRRLRQPRLAVGFPLRFSFKNFVWLVLLLSLLAVSPTIYLHTKLLLPQGRRWDCEWLQHPPLVCAHGGDSSQAPPNTIAAYRLALASRVDCIEIDASRTHDGVLVALHDRDLQAISGDRSARVGHLNASEINELDAGFGFPLKFHKQHVPTMEAALRYVTQHVKQVIIDVKVGPPEFEKGLAADIFSVIRKVECSNCVMWSKGDDIVREFMHWSSDAGSMGYIVMKDTLSGKVSKLLRMEGAGVIGAYHGLVNAQLVSTAHRAGKKLFVWTVDDESAMTQMLRARVDGIVTSLPNLLQQVMNAERQQCSINGFS